MKVVRPLKAFKDGIPKQPKKKTDIKLKVATRPISSER